MKTDMPDKEKKTQKAIKRTAIIVFAVVILMFCGWIELLLSFPQFAKDAKYFRIIEAVVVFLFFVGWIGDKIYSSRK